MTKKRVHRLCIVWKSCNRGLSVLTAATVAWGMAFVSDKTSCGTKFRALTSMDMFNRECLAIEPGRSLRGEDVARALSDVANTRPLPQRIHCDNGSEVAGRSMDLWPIRTR